MAGAPAVEVAAIADDRGNVVNYSRVYPPKPINVMDREYFAVYSGPAPPPGAWVSAPVRNRTNGKPPCRQRRRVADHLARDGEAARAFIDHVVTPALLGDKEQPPEQEEP